MKTRYDEIKDAAAAIHRMDTTPGPGSASMLDFAHVAIEASGRDVPSDEVMEAIADAADEYASVYSPDDAGLAAVILGFLDAQVGA